MNCFASGSIRCELIKTIPTNLLSLSDEAVCSFAKGFIYYYSPADWNSTGRKLTVHRFNTETLNTDSFEFLIPKNIVVNYIPLVTCNGEYLILNDDDDFSLYRFTRKNDTYVYSNKIILPPHSGGHHVLVMNGNHFLINEFYNHHPADKTFKSNLGIYDAAANKIIKFIHPEMPCIGYSHFQQQWLAVNEDRIALADPCGYKIRFFNEKLILTDSIVYAGDNDWNNLVENKLPFETDVSKIHPKLLIDKMMVLDDTISRIEKIFFISADSMLVSSICKHCGSEKRRIDLWSLSQKNSPLISKGFFPAKYTAMDSITIPESPITITSGESTITHGDLLITFSSDDYVPLKNSKTKDYDHYKDLYYESHDPHYSIQIRRIIIN